MRKTFRKPYRIKPKKSIFLNRFFWLAVLILLLGGVIFYFIIFDSFFQIKAIKVTGNEKVLTQDIENIIQSKINKKLLFFSTKSIFLVNFSEINKILLENFPQVSEPNLERGFPDTLIAKIEERKAVAIFCQTHPNFSSENLGGQDKNCFFIDKEGVMFEKTPETNNEYIKIKNLTRPTDLKLGDQGIEKEKLNQILFAGLKLKESLKILLKEVSLVSKDRLNVKTTEGWEIYFNLEGDLDWQITELSLVLEKQIPPERRKELEYIDLRFSRVYYKYK